VSEAFEERLHRIAAWCDAYPVDIFSEPDLTDARAKLGDGPYSALHASWARHLLAGIKAIATGEK
jgi:hypothetical protein